MVKRIAPEEAPLVVLDEETGAPGADVVQEDVEQPKGLPERARLNADGSVTLELRYAKALRLQRAGETIREERYDRLVLHRLTGADLNAIMATSAETSMAVAFARASRLKPAITKRLYDELDGADAADVGAVIAFFMGRGERTGR